MEAAEVVTQLKEKSNPTYLSGMKRFGIEDKNALGTPLPELRKIAKSIKKNHSLALELWRPAFMKPEY